MSDNIFRSPHASRAELHTTPTAQIADNDRGFRADVSGLGRIPLRAIPAWNDGGLRASNRENENQGVVSGGRGSTSGAGVPMATLSAKHAAAAILSDLTLT